MSQTCTEKLKVWSA